MTQKRVAEFKPYSEEKIWGHVVHIFSDPHAAVSYLHVKKDSWCSVHKHEQRANQFFVASGLVLIEIFEEGEFDEPFEVITLNQREVHTVHSGIWHRFKVLESGYMVEVYWPDIEGGSCSIEDIVRHDVGGCL